MAVLFVGDDLCPFLRCVLLPCWIVSTGPDLPLGSMPPLTSIPNPLPLTSQFTLGLPHTPLPPNTGTSQKGLILSPSADPIPYSLVQRIQSGKFLEMRDLLADNVALHSQLEDLHGHAPLASTPLPFRPRLREVPSLQFWMYCFAAYVAVRSDDPPDLGPSRLLPPCD